MGDQRGLLHEQVHVSVGPHPPALPPVLPCEESSELLPVFSCLLVIIMEYSELAMQRGNGSGKSNSNSGSISCNKKAALEFPRLTKGGEQRDGDGNG